MPPEPVAAMIVMGTTFAARWVLLTDGYPRGRRTSTMRNSNIGFRTFRPARTLVGSPL